MQNSESRYQNAELWPPKGHPRIPQIAQTPVRFSQSAFGHCKLVTANSQLRAATKARRNVPCVSRRMSPRIPRRIVRCMLTCVARCVGTYVGTCVATCIATRITSRMRR